MATPAAPATAPPPPKPARLAPPSSPIAAFFWRRRVWVEATFVLSMLEPWEQFLLLTLFFTLLVLVLTGFVKYLPQQITVALRRGTYYLWGSEVHAPVLIRSGA